MASNSKKLGELFGGTNDIKTDVLDNVDPSFVSDKNNTSTGYFDLPNGTTAQRPTAAAGMIRYNSTVNLAEYYDGSTWKSIDAPPVVSSISPTTETDPNANIVIAGSNFQSGATVKFVGDDGTEYSSPSVTFDSVSQLTATTPSTALSVANEPYDVVVTNPSGLAGTLADALDAGGVPTFNTAAGTHNIYDSSRGTAFDAGATDPDGDTITYSVSVGSLPTGASLNTSTGAITGFSAVGSDTASTFTISAATSSDTSTREFTLNVKAPIITSYTSTGSGTFSVPTGLQSMDVLLVAGGGSGGSGSYSMGGGGAGGLIYRPAYPVTPGGSISYTVGDGGTGSSSDGSKGNNGQNSTWGNLVTQGGGAGGSYDSGNNGGGPGNGNPGGSGGGGGNSPGQTTGNPGTNPNTNPTGQGWVYQGGTASQPGQPGDSGTYGFGNPGGSGGHDGGDWEGGGGGGGAGSAGTNGGPASPRGGPGGNGKAYSISGSSVTYAGGGGAGGNNPGSGGSGGGGSGAPTNGQIGQAGQSNTGGGGGGGYYSAGVTGAKGGSGIIVVKY